MSEQVVEKDLLLQVESIWKKYQKLILGFVVGAVAVFGGWYAYNTFIVAPKEEKAAEAIYKVQEYFNQDSSNLVLNGNNATGTKGALYVIKTYSGTKAANLAHYYAGISYLKLKDFNNAIKYLKEFKTGAKQIQMQAYTALGHAYAESGKKEDAVSYYTKAGSTFETDEEATALNLSFAAGLLETMNKNSEALDIYKTIKQKYPNTTVGYTVDKFIYKLSIEKNDFSTN